MVAEGVFPKADGDILYASEANKFADYRNKFYQDTAISGDNWSYVSEASTGSITDENFSTTWIGSRIIQGVGETSLILTSQNSYFLNNVYFLGNVICENISPGGSVYLNLFVSGVQNYRNIRQEAFSASNTYSLDIGSVITSPYKYNSIKCSLTGYAGATTGSVKLIIQEMGAY